MSDNVANLRQSANLAVMQLQHSQDRLQAELQFAELLCDLHPGEAKAWRALLAKAASRAEAASRPATSPAAKPQSRVPRSCWRRSPRPPRPTRSTASATAHIDMNWMWSWPETVAVTNDTFATVLRLMDEFPQFRFSQSQASVYAIIEEYNPELLARIARARARRAAGR